jgi:hypothetical protein
MKLFGIIFIIAMLTSCSILKHREDVPAVVPNLVDKDYIDQLDSMGDDYISGVNAQLVDVGSKNLKYLEKIFYRIVNNNETVFTNFDPPVFYIVKNKMPFFFSLPGARFYFSTSLFQKYLKSEELFVAALSLEIIKSKRNIYEKKIQIPFGFCSLDKMIQLTRLPTAIRSRLNEWNYIVLKRAGFDASVTLNWIQVQNRNILDFATLLGDTTSISREEHLLKNFMAKEGVSNIEKKTIEANSSKEFYQLLNQIVSVE